MARKSSSAGPLADETIEAIDHKTYRLDADMCVIADARVPVAIGGVMGGAATEVQERTRDVLIEAADFDPISIRTTARRLGLHSDSSYRFERRVDPRRHRLGQPPLCRVDPGDWPAASWPRAWSMSARRRSRASRSCCGLRN